MQRSCLYHPTEPMRVLEENQEEEYKRLLATGVWFDHPTKAKEMREKYENQIKAERLHDEKRKGSKHLKSSPRNGGESA